MFSNGGEQNLDEFTQELFAKLITATRISNNLPTEDEYQFYASFKPFKTKMNEFGKRLLDLTQSFLQHDENTKAPIINDSDDVDDVTEKFDEVVDFVDRLIEKVDLYAEESIGEKPKSNIVIAKVKTPVSARGGAKTDYNIFHGTNIARPQLQFADDIDNSPSPFLPKLTHKPNALVPLDPLIVQGGGAGNGNAKTDPALTLGPGGFYPHPYEYELRALQFLDSQLVSRPEILYKSLEDTSYTWIDTLEGLQMLADKLDYTDEIAIDLEAHSYRTYQGFVCLMQISTRREDFIIDTLPLRHHMHILNNSFTNPKIVKILHGSDSDIIWLQRDFGLYIVNLFDTGQASRVLDFPSFGLAYLLKFYCNVDADKKYQLADWRIRELPEEMIKYAREDTHYLLYIYDRLRNELVAKGNTNNNLLLSVLGRSRDLCMRRYEKEKLDETSHLIMYNKILPNHTTIFNALQMKVFAALYAWRDKVARTDDESTRYVLPNHMMFEIAAQMPVDITTLLSCCVPVPPLVRVHSSEILLIIKRTKQQYQTQPQTPGQQLAVPEISPVSRPVPVFYPNLHLQPQPQQQSDVPAPPKVAETAFTPIANGYNTHTNTPSPVLTTEQLYKTAGWLTEDDPEHETPTVSEERPATPGTPVTPRTRRRAILTKASSGALFSAPSSSDSEDGAEDEAKRTAALIRSSFASVTASFPSFASIAAPTPLPKPTIPAKVEEEEEDENADGDDEGEAKQDVEDVGSSDEVAPTPLNAEGAPAKKVPRSMAEIYQLSNQNRKRNKEKKKLKEDSLNTHPSSPVVLDEEVSPASRNKKQKTNHKRDNEKEKERGDREEKRREEAHEREKEEKRRDEEKSGAPVEEGEDTVQFMKEIGWITNKSETKANPTSQNNSNSNSNSNNNSNYVNFGNASGPGDVKSSASHTGKPQHTHNTHPENHEMANSPPRNKNPPPNSNKQQSSSPKQTRNAAHQQPQPQQHITKSHQHHPPAGSSGLPPAANFGPNSGAGGIPLPNFSPFDYNVSPTFGITTQPMSIPNPGQYFNPFGTPTATGQTNRVNPAPNNTRRAPVGSTTFRPPTHQHRR